MRTGAIAALHFVPLTEVTAFTLAFSDLVLAPLLAAPRGTGQVLLPWQLEQTLRFYVSAASVETLPPSC